MRFALFLACVIGLGGWAVYSAEPPPVKPTDAKKPVSFHKDVWPIFQRQCIGCHQPAKKGGNLVMTSYAALVKGGKDGATIVPGKPAESLLIHSLKGEGVSLMPKDAEKLPVHQVELISRWIAEGAKDDTPADMADTISPDNPPVYEGRPLITSMAYSPDGTMLAVGGYREVLIHKPDGTGILSRLIGMSQRIESIAFSPDGTKMAAVGGSPGRFGEIQIWNPKEKKLLISTNVTHDTVFGVSWTNNGKKVAVGCADNTFRVFDADTGVQTLRCEHHTDWVLGTAFSIDDNHITTVSRDRALKLTQHETGAFIDNITSIKPGALVGGLEAVDRHPTQNQVVVGGLDGVPKIYKVIRTSARTMVDDDSNLIRAFEKTPGKISDVHFSKDGKMIAVGSIGEARVYNVEDGKLICKVKFDGGVYAVSFHPEGKFFAAGGYEGVIRIADLTGKVHKEFVPVPLPEKKASN